MVILYVGDDASHTLPIAQPDPLQSDTFYKHVPILNHRFVPVQNKINFNKMIFIISTVTLIPGN